MNQNKATLNDKNLQAELLAFCCHYGISGLRNAMKLYADMQKEYLCRTKTSVSKIHLDDIYYLEIQAHNIRVHTLHGTYQKYGSLNKELNFLAPFGFFKCSQNCIVSLNKIRTIMQNTIILHDGSRLHMSRKYTPKVLTAFLGRQKASSSHAKGSKNLIITKNM